MGSVREGERQRGRVTDWDDDRGYGFITPDGGGRRIFVHASAVRGARRPSVGDDVDYTVTSGGRGPRASDVRPVGRRPRPVVEDGPLTAPPVLRQPIPASTRGLVRAAALSVVALAAVAALVVLDIVPAVFLLVELAASVLSFGLYARDKAAARAGSWRVPEAGLHLVDLLGGWPGGLVARHALRHKTQKQPFQRNFWMTVALNVVLVTVVALRGHDLGLLLSG